MSNAGKADIVIGTQYGDEGKARVVDDMAKNYDIVARFNGGANAGHTVEHNGLKVALKQVPSGIFYEGKILYVGSGCVVNIPKMLAELNSLKEIGVHLEDRLKLSSQAGVIQPHHVLLDSIIGGKIGTTKNGIGPAYSDRALRMWDERLLNIRLCDLVDDPEKYFGIMSENLKFTQETFGIANMDTGIDVEKIQSAFDVIGKLVELDTLFMQKQVEGGKNVIFEGAQSFMLDVNKGSVPYVTSSGTAAASSYVGGDLSPEFHNETVGVVKVVMSRVGHGPFVSEFGGAESEAYTMSANPDGSPTYGRGVENEYDIDALLASPSAFEMSKAIRHLSGEYGTVTTRPRRVGSLDLPQLNYAVKTNGIKKLVLTKCDLLNVYSRTNSGKMPMVTGYELDGERIDYVPGSTQAYGRVKPIIEEREIFSEDISHMRTASELPSELKEMISEVEDYTGCKVAGIGVGPQRDQYVDLS